MKKNLSFVAMILVVGLSCVAVATAGEPTSLRVKVPFDFHAGKQLLRAGSYTFHLDRVGQGAATGSRLVIRRTDGTEKTIVNTVPARSSGLNSSARLVFRKYDTSYFLSEVSSYGTACEVIRTRVEKETAARLRESQENVSLPAE